MLLLKAYDRGRAVEYARRWANGRNPLFIDFTGQGGDCTSFVSQSVYAGGCVMDYTPTFGWYYSSSADRAPSWSGVDEFYDFITGGGDFPPPAMRPGPFGMEVSYAESREGDVVQLADAMGEFYHSLIITGFDGGEILVSAHSNDALDRPLSTYDYADARILRIIGFRVEVAEGECFKDLIEGRSLGQR